MTDPRFPHDLPRFPPHTVAFLAHIRSGRFDKKADARIMGFLGENMPADLKAIIHTWAHMPGSRYVDLGEWRLESQALAGVESSLEGIEWETPSDAIDPTHAVRIGDNGRFPLLAKWSDGAKACSFVGADAEYGKVHFLGDLKALIVDPVEAHRDRYGDDKPLPGELAKILALLPG